MKKPILYIFRGDKSWMISFQGMPEEDDMQDFLAGLRPGVVATRFARDTDVEVVLKEVKAKNPAYEVRLLNWDRPKRDYVP
ncbi:MAG: hypothetical protein ACREKF_12060 [Candidatus Methylomirabilales bacterium]